MESIVSIAKGEKIKDTTRRALRLLGGINKFIKKGDSVFIKLNLMTQFCSPAIVDADVARTVVEECYKAGASKVYISDSPMSEIKSRVVLESTGYKDYLEDAGAHAIFMDEEKYVKVYSGNAKCFNEFKVPEKFVKADKFINIAKMKTHVITGVTLCIKNYQGMLLDSEKGRCHDERLCQKFVDMALFRKPDLCIVDGFYALEGDGPMFGSLKKMRTIVAGNDIVSVDHACSSMMGFEPMEIETTRLGYEQGLGNIKYSVKGEPISNVKKRFRKPFRGIPKKIAKIDLVSHIPDRGSESILKISLSFLVPYSKVFAEEFDKLDNLTIVYGGLKREVKAKTALLFGDMAIKSQNLIKAKGYIKFPGNPPTEWVGILAELSKKFDLKIMDFVSETLKGGKYEL